MQFKLALAPVAAIAFGMLSQIPVRAEEIPVEYRACVNRGLDWLVNNQHKDGYWEANGGQFRVTMTAVSGMALLMEGSTIREGKYSESIRHAVDWLMQHTQPNGLIGIPNSNEQYMYGHGFSMLFLSSVVGEEEDADRRRKLVEILDKATKFSRNAQSKHGGWYYGEDSAQKMRDNDEGSVTVTQLQGLRAARNAGIVVPTETIRDGIKYLREATNNNGGVRYSWSLGGWGSDGRPTLTAAAIVCGFSAGEYDSPLVKRWYKFCQSNLKNSYGSGARMGHDEYTYYYFAQAVYMLGDDGWAKLFPDEANNVLTWSSFRKATFETLKRSQLPDGSWGSGQVGSVFATALHLSILQLDKAVLPIYQR